MPLHTKKEFAELCGMKTGNISVYMSRGKVVYSGDYVDDSIEPNKSFLLKYRIKEADTHLTTEPILTKKVEKVKPEPLSPQKPNVQEPKRDASTPLYLLDAEKKTAEIAKIEVDTRLKLLQEQMKKGENIPTESAKTIVTHLAKSFITKFQIAADNFLLEIAKTKDLSRTETALIRTRLISIINEGSSAAVEDAKKQMRAVLREMSIKRGIGEHD